MNRFKILKLPQDYIPCSASGPILTPEEIEMVREEVEGHSLSHLFRIPEARRVQFPLFEIASNPTLPLTQIRERRFNLIERAQEFTQTSWVSDPADTTAVVQRPGEDFVRRAQDQAAREIQNEVDSDLFSFFNSINQNMELE